MASVRVVEELPASIEEAWDRIKDFGDMSAWAPKAKVVESTGSGKGAERLVETEYGMMRERCEAYDPDNYTFQYSLVEEPHGYESYLGTVAFTPIDEGRCRISWSAEFEISSAPTERVVKALEDTYSKIFIAELRKTLEGR